MGHKIGRLKFVKFATPFWCKIRLLTFQLWFQVSVMGVALQKTSPRPLFLSCPQYKSRCQLKSSKNYRKVYKIETQHWSLNPWYFYPFFATLAYWILSKGWVKSAYLAYYYSMLSQISGNFAYFFKICSPNFRLYERTEIEN